MSTAIKCPQCGNEFPLESAVFDEYKKEPAPAFHAQSIENNASMVIELKERTIRPIWCRIRRKRDDISLRNPRRFFYCNFFAGKLRADGCREHLSVARISLCVHPQRAMPLFGRAAGQRKKEAKAEYTESPHAD